MFDKLFAPPAQAPGAQADPAQNLPAQWRDLGLSVWEQARDLLCKPQAALQLDRAQAEVVLGFLYPLFIESGTQFIEEGDITHNDFMALVLSGEVTVESIVVSREAPLTVTVQGPGSMHGEMALFDGAPRSASCTASTDVLCAILTREGLGRLQRDHPALCAKLLMAVALRISQRLRDNTEKLKRYVQLTRAMQEEINALLPSR
ncbi:MAG: cyclic nucleotide-binding domain-containing protein [Rhodoferax sp.]